MRQLTIPLDIASYTKMCNAVGEFTGPFVSSPEEYKYISHDLLNSLIVVTQNLSENMAHKVPVICALFDIYMEFQRVARISIDLNNINLLSASPLYQPKDNPLLHYLYTGIGEEQVINQTFEIARHPSFEGRGNSPKDWLRRRRRDYKLMLTPQKNRVDIISRGPMIDHYLSNRGLSHIDMLLYSLSWPEPKESDVEMNRYALDLTVAAHKLLGSRIKHDIILNRAYHWKLRFATACLNRAYLDYCFIDSLFLKRFFSPTLITGAPKILGRMLSYFYQVDGREVFRFAHGGERAFFDDYYWGACELPFCSQYFGHGDGEAMNLTLRSKENRICQLSPNSPKFDSIGSRRHQKIFKESHANRNRKGRKAKKKILFVGLSTLGERLSDTLSVKLPDVHNIFLESQVCTILRHAGFHLTFKLHPRGVKQSQAYWRQMSDECLSGYFDAVNCDYDCIIFDYAGSAFCDALASNMGIVLIDTGVRKIDMQARYDIESRCKIIEAKYDSKCRLVIDDQELISAVRSASCVEACHGDFFSKYFCGVS